MDLINGSVSPDGSMFTSGSSMYSGFMPNGGAVSPSYDVGVNGGGGLDTEGYQPPTYADAFPPLPCSNSPVPLQTEAHKPWRGKSTTVTQVRYHFHSRSHTISNCVSVAKGLVTTTLFINAFNLYFKRVWSVV